MWIKLDDNLPDHPKFATVGPVAAWLYICGLCFCNRLLTDGFIPERQVRRLADIADPDMFASRLVDAGLWEQVAGGYMVHDYLKHQNSKEKVEAITKERAIAGAKGGASKSQANGKQVANGLLLNNVSKTQAEEEEDIDIKSVAQAPTPRATRKTLSAHPIPPDFTVTADMRQWARDKHISEWIDIDRHTERFILYWTVGEGQGKTRKNWRLVWENWMTREAESAEARGARRLNGNGSGSNISQIGNGKPPEGYSWEKDEGGRWIHLTGDIRTGRLPYGATTDAEVTERHRERTRLEGQNRRAAS